MAITESKFRRGKSMQENLMPFSGSTPVGDQSAFLGKGFESAEQEKYKLRPLREADRNSERDLEDCFGLLTHPENIGHFSNPPKTPEDLRQKLTNDKTHAYLAENELGEVVGTGGINDAALGEHDHFIVKVAVKPSFKSRGVGKQLVVKLTDKAFTTKAHDGRDRQKLDVAIIEEVEGWEFMKKLVEGLGFHFRSRLPRQVDVFIQGERRTLPVMRFEIMREDWMRIKRRKDISKILSSK